MTASVIVKYEGILYPIESKIGLDNSTIFSNITEKSDDHLYLSNDPKIAKILIGMVLAFYCGVIQVSLIEMSLFYKFSSFLNYTKDCFRNISHRFRD